VVALHQPAWDKQQKAQEAKRTAIAMATNHIAAFMHEFHVADVVE
jgi:hypothetical protein